MDGPYGEPSTLARTTNQAFSVERSNVLVGFRKSPNGGPVSCDEAPRNLGLLYPVGEVRVASAMTSSHAIQQTQGSMCGYCGRRSTNYSPGRVSLRTGLDRYSMIAALVPYFEIKSKRGDEQGFSCASGVQY